VRRRRSPARVGHPHRGRAEAAVDHARLHGADAARAAGADLNPRLDAPPRAPLAASARADLPRRRARLLALLLAGEEGRARAARLRGRAGAAVRGALAEAPAAPVAL